MKSESRARATRGNQYRDSEGVVLADNVANVAWAKSKRRYDIWMH